MPAKAQERVRGTWWAPVQVHQHCTASLPKEERELRESALYVTENLNMVKLALQLCDFKDVSLCVEAKHVRTTTPSHLPFPVQHHSILGQQRQHHIVGTA